MNYRFLKNDKLRLSVSIQLISLASREESKDWIDNLLKASQVSIQLISLASRERLGESYLNRCTKRVSIQLISLASRE